ncbi:hydrogenase expression/formation protein HypD [Desulfovibrio sp. X2]|uniref:hydrogenase formation protein HypD n=1 Tax=Desulfovibrio sp. X2 TaxID=941449 RepID=UPI0003587805|nr:hydrogenase formation protein HypD [Desulfovibrio sp. X2]EPR42427.1 hydrogenase expression/formation protein HypD [Desulfovibrio sp. X2]
MDFFSGFRDPAIARPLLEKIRAAGRGVRFMEVCGTHTVAIFQSGLHSLLPENIVHLTGPGCPVCVTHDAEVAAYMEAAGKDGVIMATFGDLMKVPGPGGGSLKSAQADGARVKVVYSPPDALKIAHENPNDTVVFIGVGFETTAPGIAATVKMAEAQGLSNFKVLSFHKLVPPALRALLSDPEMAVEAFILPGHVSAVIGARAYDFLAEEFKTPAVVAGFEPLDILQALILLQEMLEKGEPAVLNQYTRVVADEGNRKAQALMADVFETCDARWRGIGVIPGSGLAFRGEYERFDAMKALGIELRDVPPLPGCRCGDVLKGKLPPNKCPLFKKVCTPAKPVGPCMVSTEGSCAAYFKYNLES